MNLRRLWHTLLCACIGLPSVALSADAEGYETLTNPQGKEIIAKIVDVHRDKVTIRLKTTGDEMLVGMSMFSDDSQALIKKWQTERALSDGLEFGFSEKRFDAEKGQSTARKWVDGNEGYTIRVANTSNVPVRGITVKYVIVAKMEITDRRDKDEHTIETHYGSLTFPAIQPEQQLKMETIGVTLRKEEMLPGWTSGGANESEDELEGIVAEFYHNGRLIATEASRRTLIGKYPVDPAQGGRR